MPRRLSDAIVASLIAGLSTVCFAQQQPSLGDIARQTEQAQAKKADARPASEKAASATATSSVACGPLLQHPLAWWLSAAPTAVERDQLTACMSAPAAHETRLQPITPTPVVWVKPANWNTMTTLEQAQWMCRNLDAPDWQPMPTELKVAACRDLASQSIAPSPSSASSAQKPANWNTMTADDQAAWYRLAPKTWLQMTEQERSDWTRILTPKAGSSPASVATVTADSCESERQSLALLSEQIKHDIAQLQVLAAQPPAGSAATAPASPPTYRCDSSTLGSQTTTTCQPEPKYASPGAAASQAFEQSMAQQTAERRWNVLAAQVRTEQDQFDARLRQWNSSCVKH